MDNPKLIEEWYLKYTQNLGSWAPEGIIVMDLKKLKELDLLDFKKEVTEEQNLSRFFHVIESPDKITLFDDQYVVWIVPENNDGNPITYIFIALNYTEELSLEIVFSTSGVYNSSLLVLRILERFLNDIQENEEIIKKLKSKAS